MAKRNVNEDAQQPGMVDTLTNQVKSNPEQTVQATWDNAISNLKPQSAEDYDNLVQQVQQSLGLSGQNPSAKGLSQVSANGIQAQGNPLPQSTLDNVPTQPITPTQTMGASTPPQSVQAPQPTQAPSYPNYGAKMGNPMKQSYRSRNKPFREDLDRAKSSTKGEDQEYTGMTKLEQAQAIIKDLKKKKATDANILFSLVNRLFIDVETAQKILDKEIKKDEFPDKIDAITDMPQDGIMRDIPINDIFLKENEEPYKKGDRVVLIRLPFDSGVMEKYIMNKQLPGTVLSSYNDMGHILYDVRFDNGSTFECHGMDIKGINPPMNPKDWKHSNVYTEGRIICPKCGATGNNIMTEPYGKCECKECGDKFPVNGSEEDNLNEDSIYNHSHITTNNNYDYGSYDFYQIRDPYEFELNSTQLVARAMIVDQRYTYEMRFQVMKETDARFPQAWKFLLFHDIRHVLKISVNLLNANTNYMKLSPDSAPIFNETRIAKIAALAFKSYIKLWGKQHFQIIVIETENPMRLIFNTLLAKELAKITGIKIDQDLALEMTGKPLEHTNVPGKPKLYIVLTNAAGGKIKESIEEAQNFTPPIDSSFTKDIEGPDDISEREYEEKVNAYWTPILNLLFQVKQLGSDKFKASNGYSVLMYKCGTYKEHFMIKKALAKPILDMKAMINGNNIRNICTSTEFFVNEKYIDIIKDICMEIKIALKQKKDSKQQSLDQKQAYLSLSPQLESQRIKESLDENQSYEEGIFTKELQFPKKGIEINYTSFSSAEEITQKFGKLFDRTQELFDEINSIPFYHKVKRSKLFSMEGFPIDEHFSIRYSNSGTLIAYNKIIIAETPDFNNEAYYKSEFFYYDNYSTQLKEFYSIAQAVIEEIKNAKLHKKDLSLGTGEVSELSFDEAQVDEDTESSAFMPPAPENVEGLVTNPNTPHGKKVPFGGKTGQELRQDSIDSLRKMGVPGY